MRILWVLLMGVVIGCSGGSDALEHGWTENGGAAGVEDGGAPSLTTGGEATGGDQVVADAGGAGGAGGATEAGGAGGASEPKRKHVIFLAGQSNVIALYGTEPHEGLPDDSIGLISRSLGPDGCIFDSGGVVPLDLVSGHHSIEIEAARRLRMAGQDVAVVKVSRGATWIAQWLPNANPVTYGYWQAIEKAKGDAEIAWGPEIVWSFIWLQSESDAQVVSHAAIYEGNLRTFVAAIRGLFGEIDFYQCKLQPHLAYASSEVVRSAQVKVMGENSRNHLLDFDDINGKLHYSSDQLDEMGRRAGDAMLLE